MVKNTIKSIYKEMLAIGTFKQKDFSDKVSIVELPYLSHSEAKHIIRDYQTKVAEIVEFKKFNEETLNNHNGNYVVKVHNGSDRLSFEVICKDKPFDNRNKIVVKVTVKPETFTFDKFAKMANIPAKLKKSFSELVKDKEFTLKEWKKNYSEWLEKPKQVEKKVSFSTFVTTTKKEPNWVKRFISENNVDEFHTISEWDEIFINWVPQKITFNEFARAKNLSKETVALYNKDDNTDSLILPVEKWEKRYNRWLAFRKTTTEKKTETTVFDGKVVYKNVEFLLSKQGKNFQDLKNCLPVKMVANIIKTKDMQGITPEQAAKIVAYLNTDVNFFLNRNSKVKYDETIPTETSQKEMEKETTEETKTVDTIINKDVSTKNIETPTTVESTPKNTENVAKVGKETTEPEKSQHSVKMLTEDETKEILKEEKDKFVNRNKELVEKLLDCFDLNAHLTLPEDFKFKTLNAYLQDERKDNYKSQTRDFILSNVFVDTTNCAIGEMSKDFVQNLKTIVDELYENQKTINSYNV